MNISVVIPAYNESQIIKTTVQELSLALSKIPGITKSEIIVIDDHSSDSTFEAAQSADAKVKVLRLSRSSGSHIALRAGIQEATGEALLCISADGQDDPVCLEKMLKKMQKGANVVWALREDRRQEPLLIRSPAEAFYKILFWLLKKDENNIDLSRADFFLMDRGVADAIISCPERNTSLFGLIVWLGFNQDSVEYKRRKRIAGKSKWTFRSRFNLAKDWIIAFSGLPLKVASFAGFAMSILGALVAIYVIIDKLFFSNVMPGWTSIVVLVLIIGGIQLTMLGVIGEYLWRNLDESRRRPLFFFEKKS